MANINRDSVSLDSYEKMTKYYFKEVDTKSFNAYYERPGLTSIIGDVEGMKVLDAGCAAGWYTNWLLEKEDYFKLELVEDEWETSIGTILVDFYTRPLSKILEGPLSSGFVISRLEEPMPTDKFREVNPEKYDIVLKKPRFLFIEAIKK